MILIIAWAIVVLLVVKHFSSKSHPRDYFEDLMISLFAVFCLGSIVFLVLSGIFGDCEWSQNVTKTEYKIESVGNFSVQATDDSYLFKTADNGNLWSVLKENVDVETGDNTVTIVDYSSDNWFTFFDKTDKYILKIPDGPVDWPG